MAPTSFTDISLEIEDGRRRASNFLQRISLANDASACGAPRSKPFSQHSICTCKRHSTVSKHLFCLEHTFIRDRWPLDVSHGICVSNACSMATSGYLHNTTYFSVGKDLHPAHRHTAESPDSTLVYLSAGIHSETQRETIAYQCHLPTPSD